MGHFPDRFTGKTQTLFHESKLFFIIVSSIQSNTLHPRREVSQITKIAPFSVKPFITLSCRNSSINPVTNEFYFGILTRSANETGCGILIDQ